MSVTRGLVYTLDMYTKLEIVLSFLISDPASLVHRHYGGCGCIAAFTYNLDPDGCCIRFQACVFPGLQLHPW